MNFSLDLLLQVLAIVAAGFGAGFINVLVGSGTLITFPVLLMFGYPALSANMSNCIGLVAGNISGVWGYRKEIAQNKSIAQKLVFGSAAGGLTGALLLLWLPSGVFDIAVPMLIALGIVMVAVSPFVQKITVARLKAQGLRESALQPAQLVRPFAAIVTVFLLGIYGGYFGAAQGVLLIGSLGMLLVISLQALVGLKNLLSAVVNFLAALIFILCAFDQINWWVVLYIAVGSTLGGLAGAKVGRRLPPTLLRVVIILVGLVALANMLF